MDIGFANRDLEKLCNNGRYANRKLGSMSARKLRSRLADIAAARNVTELVAGKPHPLTGNRTGDFSLRLHGGHRLVFTADHDPFPMKEDGGIDWRAVTVVRVVEIGDYHDG